jgi:HTH-type transcriptional regulator / antitoxin HigA
LLRNLALAGELVRLRRPATEVAFSPLHLAYRWCIHNVDSQNENHQAVNPGHVLAAESASRKRLIVLAQVGKKGPMDLPSGRAGDVPPRRCRDGRQWSNRRDIQYRGKQVPLDNGDSLQPPIGFHPHGAYTRRVQQTEVEGRIMSKPVTTKAFRHFPKTYRALVAMLPPRPIHDDVDLANATEVIDGMAGFALNSDQEDYLEAISTFVEAYEAARFPIADSRIAPLDALKALLAEHGMTASDLGRLLGNRTLGTSLLTGRRALSKAHIKKLAEHFKVEATLFL